MNVYERERERKKKLRTAQKKRIRKRTDIWVLFHLYTLCECSGLDIAHTNVELNIH
jgi:hypothetical protein